MPPPAADTDTDEPTAPRPVFVLGAPDAGEGPLLAALALAPGTARRDATDVLPLDDGRQRDLTRADARTLGEQAITAIAATDAEVVVVGGAPLARSVPFLAATFPEARFVLLVRDPLDAIVDRDAPPAIAADAWRTTTERLLDDLDSLDPLRWSAADRAHLLAEPRRELRRLCLFLDIPYDQALLGPLEHERRREQARVPELATEELAAALRTTTSTKQRLADLVPPPPATPRRTPTEPLASVSTDSFPQRLEALQGSLLISTYQTNKLILARQRDGQLNTHFRDLDKPMGLAVRRDRLAVGTRTELVEYRDVPAVAPKLDPPGTHDACYLPYRRHTTGDIAIHELAHADDGLWFVATAFSCLATLDADHSFVPRWSPPFITALAPGDRCHLNGLAVVDGAVGYVTALGETDVPGGWRAGKAAGGVLLEVPSGEVVARGLSMPHSPRVHDGVLYVLESGRGALSTVDRRTGETTLVAELPGFTRGLAIAGTTAFVGLSQIRESSTFGDLPITARLRDRQCGVWTVDLRTGQVEGFLRFDDLVQEVFDVALLPGRRWPELAEPASPAVATTYVLP